MNIPNNGSQWLPKLVRQKAEEYGSSLTLTGEVKNVYQEDFYNAFTSPEGLAVLEAVYRYGVETDSAYDYSTDFEEWINDGWQEQVKELKGEK